MKPHSVVRRISISFGLLSACVLLLLGGFLYRSLAEHVEQSDTADAIGKVKLVRHILAGFKSTEDISRNPQRLQDLLVGHPDLIVRIQDVNGRIVFGPVDISALQEVVWVNFGDKSSISRVKNGVSGVARN